MSAYTEGCTEDIYKIFRHVASFVDRVNHLGSKNESQRIWQHLKNLQRFKGSLNQPCPELHEILINSKKTPHYLLFCLTRT